MDAIFVGYRAFVSSSLYEHGGHQPLVLPKLRHQETRSAQSRRTNGQQVERQTAKESCRAVRYWIFVLHLSIRDSMAVDVYRTWYLTIHFVCHYPMPSSGQKSKVDIRRNGWSMGTCIHLQYIRHQNCISQCWKWPLFTPRTFECFRAHRRGSADLRA